MNYRNWPLRANAARLPPGRGKKEGPIRGPERGKKKFGNQR